VRHYLKLKYFFFFKAFILIALLLHFQNKDKLLGESKDVKFQKNLHAFIISDSGKRHKLNNNLKWESLGLFEQMALENTDDNAWQPQIIINNDKTENEYLVAFKYRCLYRSSDDGNFWKLEKAARKRAVDYDLKACRSVTSIDANLNFISHKHEILYRQNNRWIKFSHNLRKSRYITAVYSDKKSLYVGTAASGLFAAHDYKKQIENKKKLEFENISEGLPFIPHEKDFRLYEEIRAVFKDKKGNLFAGTSIQGDVFIRPHEKEKFISLNVIDEIEKSADIYSISGSEKLQSLWISTGDALHVIKYRDIQSFIEKSKNTLPQKIYLWKNILFEKNDNVLAAHIGHKKDGNLTAFFYKKSTALAPERRKRINKASNKKLFYSSAINLKKNKKEVFSLLKQSAFDGFVLDVKDDNGYIRYDSKEPFLKEIGAVRPLVNLQEAVEFAHKHGKYVVARIVVFKDAVLFKQKGFAILNKRTKKPWIGNEKERWVDPYNKELAEKYYVPFIKELTRYGVDEIQLDYIRLPSDGPVYLAYFSHKQTSDMYASEALENFIYQIRSSTHLPISVDIYGYNALYRAPGIIGQDMEVYGDLADVVCPMLYSSHFGDSYLTGGPIEERAYRLLSHSALRSMHIASDRFLLRPYLQAFPMKNSIWGYGKKYFLDQVRAYEDYNLKGFTFWGAFDHILKVKKALVDG